MRILYSAIDQTVPGTTGGAVHVSSVATGLSALGHDVHVVTGKGAGDWPAGRITWHAMTPPLGSRHLRLLRAGPVRAIARRIKPDAVIERYHNFGGEGLLAAKAVGARGVLEVNAPIIDFPDSPKRRLDRAMLVEPMRRWRDWQCRTASLIVTPSRAIVPAWLPAERIVELEWGADTVRFQPGATGPVPFSRQAWHTLVIFAGAFRTWHGAIHLVKAIGRLRARGVRDIDAVLVGDGPERAAAMRAAEGIEGIQFTGAIPHDQMPAILAAADVGVAPFDVAAHAPLMLDFYWSPLKIFEYMASGLPVVAPDIARLHRIITPGKEGLLYDARDPDGLAHALEGLTDPHVRSTIGRAARERVVRDFGWDVHCRGLAEAIARH